MLGEKISSNSKAATELFEKQRFGERFGEKIFYSLSEALYLLESKKMKILDYKEKEILLKDFKNKLQRIDKKFKQKYIVFKDLREKGYIPKTALKFGAEFRVYEPGKKIGKHHAKWLLYITSENEKITWHEFSAKNRVAHSTKKHLLIAVVDQENDVSYYEVSWMKL